MAASPSPSPDAEVTVGSVLDGRYRIDAVIGTGGMGRVYRGEHTGIGRQVAIKVLHADLTRNRDAAARFQREALASGRLDHPNIVAVTDFGILDDGACYLVMEVLEGESLGDLLQRERKLSWQDAIDILRGVLSGLRHAHDRGVVHRDIKPDNVYLAKKDSDTVVKILDFGIAKLYAGTAEDPAATRAGLTVGTPAYLSPEQAVGGEITPKSDLYSATVLLFEMLAGRPPFEDKDPLAMLGAHVSRTPPRVLEVAPQVELPPGLEDVIEQGLRKPVAERIASASDYLALLDRVTMGRGSLVSVPRNALTPAGGSRLVTPVPGSLSTAAPTVSTESVDTPRPASISGGGPPFSSPGADEPDPIPKRWIVSGALVLAVLVALAILIGLSTRTTDDSPTPGKPIQPLPVIRPTPPLAPPPSAPDDHEIRLKAALHDLKNAKTCAERKAAIPKIVDLGDEKVIPDLKAARYRGYGGLLGIGERNANACLVKDIDAAIKELSED